MESIVLTSAFKQMVQQAIEDARSAPAELQPRPRRRRAGWGRLERCAICAAAEEVTPFKLPHTGTQGRSAYRLFCQPCREVATRLIEEGLSFKSRAHHGIFCTIKAKVKVARGLGNDNLFRPEGS
jgi:hypothetical protein